VKNGTEDGRKNQAERYEQLVQENTKNDGNEKYSSKKNSSDKTEIRNSSISGKGAFAKKKIAAGEYITTLTGKIVSSGTDVSQICAEFSISGDDPLQIHHNKFIILDYISKTINHCCNPNAGIRNKSDLYAIRDININEEITYDYSTTSGIDDRWTMSCGCNSEKCRKVIGSVVALPPATLSKYLAAGALPDFIKEQLEDEMQAIEI
jgi:SET domain-containing protein